MRRSQYGLALLLGLTGSALGQLDEAALLQRMARLEPVLLSEGHLTSEVRSDVHLIAYQQRCQLVIESRHGDGTLWYDPFRPDELLIMPATPLLQAANMRSQLSLSLADAVSSSGEVKVGAHRYALTQVQPVSSTQVFRVKADVEADEGLLEHLLGFRQMEVTYQGAHPAQQFRLTGFEYALMQLTRCQVKS